MEPSSPLREGDSVRLSCDAQSPVALDYQWKDAKVSMRLVLLCFRLRGAGLCGKLGRARSLLHPPERGQGWESPCCGPALPVPTPSPPG